jgi:hypothetical protein
VLFPRRIGGLEPNVQPVAIAHELVTGPLTNLVGAIPLGPFSVSMSQKEVNQEAYQSEQEESQKSDYGPAGVQLLGPRERDRSRADTVSSGQTG